MRLKSIQVTNFKRFADLQIRNLPPTARLILLLGPNGCGKSSIFDAFHSHLKMSRFIGINSNLWDYFDRLSSLPERDSIHNYNQEIQTRVKLVFHGGNPTSEEQYKKSMYLRTAYRNEPTLHNTTISSSPSILDENRITRLIDDDKTVESNYRRMIWRLLQQVTTPGLMTDDIMKDTIGDLQDTLLHVFGDLALDALVTPEERGSFTFSKGDIKNFLYENLSGGEKAAFDLLLDVIANREVYDDSLYCIDEPEAHLNTRLQGKVLGELYRLIPKHSQLWIATHSIGMVRKAEELRISNPNEVVFLDFGFRDDGKARNFDQRETIEPSSPDYEFWSRHYDIALGDLANLVAPEKVVLCEGRVTAGKNAFDAACYNKIFSKEYPRVIFLSVGSAGDIKKRMEALLPVIEQIVEGTHIIRFRDRDDLTETEMSEVRRKGIRVLTKFRNLESLLLSDDVLRTFCESHGREEVLDQILEARDKVVSNMTEAGKPGGDLKPAAQAVHQSARRLLSLDRSGETKEAFMRDFLVPTISPSTEVYRALKRDIFDE